MRQKFTGHFISILFIGFIFFIIHTWVKSESTEKTYNYGDQIQDYMQLPFLDLNSPEDRILLQETLNFYDPRNLAQHNDLMVDLEHYLNDRMTVSVRIRELSDGISVKRLMIILGMLLKFAVVYILVLLLTYYGVETFAIYRFIRTQNPLTFITSLTVAGQRVMNARSWPKRLNYLWQLLVKIGLGLLRALIMLTLFAPAYVIAYSFKTSFDTDSLLLMIILGVISNGLLITYTQKYYTFLVSESRKGYVQTAIVKNLKHEYRFRRKDGISFSSIFRLKKKFPGHVFGHIYQNVRVQYLNTLKEQASFLISGLIIIEMALNIQGHLCYELMQNILYKNFSAVLIIIFGVFLIVKLTEIFIDHLVSVQRRKIDNISPVPAG
jgi:hypothetical protein